MKEENLVKEQMKIISNLQEKIKLLQFDVSANLKKIHYLEDKLKRKNRTISNVREELTMMKRQEDYKNISNVLKYLRESEYEN